MATTQTFPLKLNEAQILILQLFQHRRMNEEELRVFRRTLVPHLSNEPDMTEGHAGKRNYGRSTCRWIIEEVFRILKKGGFDIESSELSQAKAIRKLSDDARNYCQGIYHA